METTERRQQDGFSARNQPQRLARILLLLLLTIASSLSWLPAAATQSSEDLRFTRLLKFQEVSPGIEHGQISAGYASKDELTGPWFINILRIDPNTENDREKWRRAYSIVGAGPQLIKAGKVEITDKQEKMGPTFRRDRHPRTAIGRLASGRLVLVTVDGRQTGVSAGMSLDTLAGLLLELGTVEAINLDGGGSTTMVVRNRLVNRPSDQTGERPVSDAILVFSKPN